MEPINKIEQTYRDLTAQGKKILKLFSGNPNEQGFHFPPEILERCYRDYFRRQSYTPHPKGLPAARQAIANYYERASASVDPEHLLLTSGTSESFFYLFSLLAQPGDNILTPNPSYPLFDQIGRLTGVELRPYPLCEPSNWAIDLKELTNKIDARTRAIVLISPNNPTGAVTTEAEIREIVALANSKEIPLICDEVFSEFYFGPGRFPRPIAMTTPSLCFTLNGISKMFALPGLKLGWIAVTGEKNRVEAVVDQLELTADTFLSTHLPIQEALPFLFTEGQLFLQRYCAEVKRRRRLAIDLLSTSPHLKFVPPAGGFFLMVEVTSTSPRSEEDFVIALMREESIFVHPGYFYDYEVGTHVVISHLLEEKKLREGVEKLIRFVVNSR